MNKIIFRTDARDRDFHGKFGQSIILPEECNFDTEDFDDVQPIGDVKCVCYSTVDIATDQQKRDFDILDLWERVPKNQFGSDPRDVLSEAVKNGLLPKGLSDRVKDWKSYWSAISGARDPFDNLRSAVVLSNSPVMVATYWHAEWLNVPPMGVMPVGKGQLNGHAYVVEGWKQLNGQPHLIIEAWVGRKMLMPRDVFNEAMKPYGMQAWVLSTSEIDARREKTILEAIRDVCLNVIILMKQLLLVKKTETVVVDDPVKDTYTEVKDAVMDGKIIQNWAKAIDKWEGNTFGNNPGNLKYSPLIASFGAKQGKPGSDGGHFAVFDTYEQGFNALCKFLELGCKNQLKSYKNARTLGKFMKIYAGNPPQGYLNGIEKELGIGLDVNIETFL